MAASSYRGSAIGLFLLIVGQFACLAPSGGTGDDDDGTPADDDGTPADDDGTPADDDGTPADDDTTAPPDDDSGPTDDDGTPVEDDDATPPPDDDATPPDDDGTPVEDDDATPPPDDDAAPLAVDDDGDGFCEEGPCSHPGHEPGDCDDGDASVHPGADERCDGVDEDCDGRVDDVLYGAVSLDGCATHARLIGEEAGDRAGYSVASAGDVDGDGYADLLVGAPEHAGKGAAYLVHGPVSGAVDLADAGAKLLGERPGDWAGTSVAGVGDADGDGLDDIAVGAPYADVGAGDSGAVYLIYGPVAGTLLLADSDARLRGESGGDHAGMSVAGAGDFDRDGLPDLVVGAPDSSASGTSAGSAFVVLSPVGGEVDLGEAEVVLRGQYLHDDAGMSVAGAGDVDWDGYSDVVIGVPGLDWGALSSGSAYIVRGGTTGEWSLSAAAARLTGEADYDFAGTAVAGAGDVDWDGYDDVLVGAYYSDRGAPHAGVSYLVSGPMSGTAYLSSSDAVFVGEEPDTWSGRSVSGPGDVNRDGFADVLVGMPWSAGAGGAFLFLGPVLGDFSVGSADAVLNGPTAGAQLGFSVAGAGDMNGDGYADLLLGAPGDSEGGAEAGAAWLVLGGER